MKKWTIIIQINAENNLIYDSISVFNELGKAEHQDHVNYVVLFDGMPDPRYPEAPEHPAIYLMDFEMEYGKAQPVEVFGDEFDNLADPKILQEVLSAIKTAYPAENYGFIYKGHGGAGGTDIGVQKIFNTKLMEKPPGTDEQVEAELVRLGGRKQEYEGYTEFDNNNNIIMAIYTSKEEGDCLTYKELGKVLTKTFGEKGLGFVCLDCCWGQQIEHAYSFRKATSYFVASVDEMTSLGLGYLELCRYLNKRPTILPYELASMFVAVNYIKNYADYDSLIPEFREMGVSLTAVNTTNLETSLNLFNDICERMTEHMERNADNITKALDCCKDYTYQMERSMYAVYNLDLVWFLENFMHFNKRDHVLNDMIMKFIRYHLLYYIRGFMGNNYKMVDPGNPELGGRGVSIAFPRNKEEMESSIYFGTGKPDFVRDSGWKKVLTTYYSHTPAPKKRGIAPLTRGLRESNPIIEIIRERIHSGGADSKWREFHPAKKKLTADISRQ